MPRIPSTPSPRQDRPSTRDTRIVILVGVAIFLVATALFASRMATSFVPGDSANYLNRANTGSVTDRGNGIPLYITLLNLAAKLPLPFFVSDGVRCNLLTVLLAAATLTLCYLGAWRLTRSIVASLVSVVTLMISGLIWTTSVLIMPHITLALIAATFCLLLVTYDETGSAKAIAGMGLVCGVGFGLMPNAVLFLPVALLHPRLNRQPGAHVRRAFVGFLVGMGFNGALLAFHEIWNPTVTTSGMSVWEASAYYLRGARETSWFVENLTLARIARGVVRMPLEIAADFEIVASALAVSGLVVGLRSRPRLHASLALGLVIMSMWVGAYPGDTHILHGVAAYPIAALWVARGSQWAIEGARRLASRTPLGGLAPAGQRIVLGGAAVFLVLAGVAGGHVTYQERLCRTRHWSLLGFCRERLPTGAGDFYLRRARAALDEIPEGALVFGATWDATDQMNYFIRVHRTRDDLEGAYDLTKLSKEAFLDAAGPHWSRNDPVFLFGEWKDVELWSPELLASVQARAHGELVFQLLPSGPDAGSASSAARPRGDDPPDRAAPRG